jgi:hypothetical protein
VGILPAAIVAEAVAVRIAPAVGVAVVVAQVEAVAGDRMGAVVEVVEVAALITEFTTLNQPHRQL